MINLSAWCYRNLLAVNDLINNPEFYEVNFLDNSHKYEANVFLKDHLRPNWVNSSEIYKNCDGSGTSIYKNIAVFKAISEALERLAFYDLAENKEKEYCFDKNPTTTGMAAFPSFSKSIARKNARVEAWERWAIHEFNRSKLPVLMHKSEIQNLNHYEIKIPFKESHVSLLSYKKIIFTLMVLQVE